MPNFFAAQIQIPIPNKYLGFAYKGLVFCRNNGSLMKNIDKGLTVTKMGADKLTENTPNALKLSAQAQKFGILMKKGFIGCPYSVDNGYVIRLWFCRIFITLL